MKEQPLRFGLLGVGGMGRGHAREIAGRSDAQIVAVCDVNSAAIEQLFGALPMVDRQSVAVFAKPEAMLLRLH
ncbi:MAG: Gfo/Idh/MocA family oxidoreductase, partial [Chloroflexi bacterium]|nr:Gfo/Idh/MocA family oxidoreductase [Chloroflexota bacterium]